MEYNKRSTPEAKLGRCPKLVTTPVAAATTTYRPGDIKVEHVTLSRGYIWIGFNVPPEKGGRSLVLTLDEQFHPPIKQTVEISNFERSQCAKDSKSWATYGNIW